ncbi:very large A-kinase anchor protein isoform X2 [Rhinatrema bivittatum]|uniref:very large A-kinase anchor protein isoform X2 n=1 Tax=Rhinatrema bivittatum TaxID=194408 RepID=UPI00112ECB82|nr:very large A-kinase anchor protein isoform X2 [Rhinatrema bivittatum]
MVLEAALTDCTVCVCEHICAYNYPLLLSILGLVHVLLWLHKVSQSVDESNCSSEEGENSSAQELMSTNDSPSVLPEVKMAENDKQPREPFLHFLGQLFNFASKSELNRESKPSALKDDHSKAEEDSQCQSSPDGGRNVDLGQTERLRSTRSSASREEISLSNLTPASSQDTEEGSEPEIADALKQIECKESAPAVTYATYRGSRQIRKLLKRRAHVDNAIPERDENPGTNDTFDVTKNGDIENGTLANTQTEGHWSERETKDEDEVAEIEWKKSDKVKQVFNHFAPEKCTSTPEAALNSNNTEEARSFPSKHVPFYTQTSSSDLDLLSEAKSKISSSSSCQNTITLERNLTNNRLNKNESQANGLREVDFQSMARISNMEKVPNSHPESSHHSESVSSPERKCANEKLKLTDSFAGRSELQGCTHGSQESSGLQMHMAPETENSCGDENPRTVETEQSKAQNMQDPKLGVSFASRELVSSDVVRERENSRTCKYFHASKKSRHAPENLSQTVASEYQSDSTISISPHARESDSGNAADVSVDLGKVSYPALEIENVASSRLKAYEDEKLSLAIQVAMESIASTDLEGLSIGQHLPEANHVSMAESSRITSSSHDDHQIKFSIPDFSSDDISMLPNIFDHSSMIKTSALTQSSDNSEINCPSSALPSDCDTLAKISLPALVSDADPAAGISPTALVSDADPAAGISPPALVSDADPAAGISPPALVSDADPAAGISPPALVSDADPAAGISPPALVSDADPAAGISPPALVSDADPAAGISPPALVSVADPAAGISPPALVSEADPAAGISPPVLVSDADPAAGISPPALVLEADPPIQGQGISHLTSVPNDVNTLNIAKMLPSVLASKGVCVAKVSVKSIDVNRVKILAHTLDPEVIHVSKIIPSALEPEYICIANLPALPNESSVLSKISPPTLGTEDPTLVTDSAHMVNNISSLSITNGNDCVGNISSSTSDDDNNIAIIVTESEHCNENKITSPAECKNVSLANICPHSPESTGISMATTSIPALKLDGGCQIKIKNPVLTSKNVNMDNISFAIKPKNISITKNSFPDLECGKTIVTKASPESSDVTGSWVSLLGTESLNASVTKNSPLGDGDAIMVEALPSDICHLESFDTVSPSIKQTNKERASIPLPCQPNPGISEVKPSFVSSEAKEITDQADIQAKAEHSTSRDVSCVLLNKVDEIVGNILHSAIEDLRANQASPVHQIRAKKEASLSSKIPEECLEESPLTSERNEIFQGDGDENRSFGTPARVDVQSLLALKAEEIINAVINLAKEKVTSEEVELSLDKTHNIMVLTSCIGSSAGPDAALTLKAEDITNKYSGTKIPKSSELLDGLFKVSEASNCSVPLSLQTVLNCTDLTLKTGETVQNSMHLTPRNGLLHSNSKVVMEWDPADISKDLLTREMITNQGNESSLAISTARPETVLPLQEFNRIVTEKLQTLQTDLPSDVNESKALSLIERDTDTENVLAEDVSHSTEMQEGQNCLCFLSQDDCSNPNFSVALQHNGISEDEEQNVSVEEMVQRYRLFSDPPANGFQHYAASEVMAREDDPDCRYRETEELPDNPDSFLAIQAKRFRIYPFSLSPIYEDESSQEDFISSSGSPGYPSEKSTLDNEKQSSFSVLSLLQSVSDRLKHSRELNEDEEKSSEEKTPFQDEVPPTSESTDHVNDRPMSAEPEPAPSSNTVLSSSADPTLPNLQGETSPAVALTDLSLAVPQADQATKSRAASRSVYYQYLQAAKTYSLEKEVKVGSIFEEMLLPKDPPEDDFLKTALLVNPIDREGLKYNSRPGKMVIYNVPGSRNKLEIYSDVPDATPWTFPRGTLIRVVRGCWILYNKPMFQGQTYVLEEGETALPDLWDFHSSIVIGSIRRVLKDSEVPEVEIFPQTGSKDAPIFVQTEIAQLTDSQINVKGGIWLAYSDFQHKGTVRVLEARQAPSLGTETDVKSLRPLKMGGLKVQMPTDPHMIIYEKANFGGWAQELTDHLYALSDLPGIERDFHGIGSIRVTGGVWVAYEREHYKGRQYLLEEGEYEDWQTWDSAGSTLGSFRYVQADFLEPSVKLLESDTDVKMVEFNQDIPDLEEAGFGIEMRSIQVQNGMWVAYQQKHYNGEQYVLEKGRYKSCLDWGASSNTILSIRPVMLEPLGRQEPVHLLKAYSQENFQGACVAFTAEVSDLASPGSIKVLRGCWLLRYEWERAVHYCVLEEGHYPNLASCGCPTVDIKSLQPVEHVFAEPSISLFALDSCEGRELQFEEAAHSILNQDLYFYTQSVRVESGLWIMYEGANFLGRQALLEPCEIPSWMEFSGWKAVGSLRPLKQPTVYFQIKHQAEEKYLTVTGKVTDTRGTSVCLSAWNGKDTQIWYYRRGLIKSKITGACLDVIGGRDAPGSKVALWTEHGKPRQKWRFHKNGTISCYLSEQLLLDVKGGKYYDRNHIVVNHPLGSEHLQKWAVEIL